MASTEYDARLLDGWRLTFDMSGGGQTAKLAGRRPLDEAVRRSRFEDSADVTSYAPLEAEPARGQRRRQCGLPERAFAALAARASR